VFKFFKYQYFTAFEVYNLCRTVRSQIEIIWNVIIFWYFLVLTAPVGPGSPHCRGFTITLRHITLGRTPLDEWSARRWKLWQHTTLTRDKRTCSRRDSNRQSQQPRGHCNRPYFIMFTIGHISLCSQSAIFHYVHNWPYFIMFTIGRISLCSQSTIFQYGKNDFHIRSVHLDIIKILFIHQLMH
jgi:hypothetical protein